MEGCHGRNNHFQKKKNYFLCYFERIKPTRPTFFFRFLLNNFLTPSVRPFGFTDWIRFMHKAPTHASGLLMTGPYADTLTAMSNYFKYTGEGRSSG